jgi:hypothetical protein
MSEISKDSIYPKYIHAKYKSLRGSAKRRGFECKLTKSDLLDLFNQKTCYYTGRLLDDIEGSIYRRSIERIDSDIGYIKENVAAVCGPINNRIGKLKRTKCLELYRDYGIDIPDKVAKQVIRRTNCCSLSIKEFKIVYRKMVLHFLKDVIEIRNYLVEHFNNV